MSVFNAIKGKIVNVKNDLSQSLRSLTSSHPSSEDENPMFTSDSDADVELLSRYQNSWRELHQTSEELGMKAQSVDNLIFSVFQFLGRQNDLVNHFLKEISSVDRLFEDITKIKENLDHIGDTCGKVESMLTELEGVHEHHKLFAKKCEHEYQLKKFQRQRHLDLEQTKANLASRHATKVRQFEEHCNATLLERQKVFSEVHSEQMQSYKTLGYVDLMVPSPSHMTEASVDLADIDIGEDPVSLDEFLESSETDVAQTQPLPVASQLSGEAILDGDDTTEDNVDNISNLPSVMTILQDEDSLSINDKLKEELSVPNEAQANATNSKSIPCDMVATETNH